MYEVDVGSNLTGLGVLFLLLKYILPVLVVLGVIFGVYLVYRQVRTDIQNQIPPIGWMYLLAGLCLLIIIVIVAAT